MLRRRNTQIVLTCCGLANCKTLVLSQSSVLSEDKTASAHINSSASGHLIMIDRSSREATSKAEARAKTLHSNGVFLCSNSQLSLQKNMPLERIHDDSIKWVGKQQQNKPRKPPKRRFERAIKNEASAQIEIKQQIKLSCYFTSPLAIYELDQQEDQLFWAGKS